MFIVLVMCMGLELGVSRRCVWVNMVSVCLSVFLLVRFSGVCW